MALKIRLTRLGKRKEPHYRIIVCEEHSKRDGAYIDKIGIYNPLVSPHQLVVDEEKLSKWLKNGAQLSDGVRRLLKTKPVTKTQA